MEKSYPLNPCSSIRLASPVDNSRPKRYKVINRPVKPLPQGMRNLTGIFLGFFSGLRE
jgi:hypothetical protein